MLNAGGVFALAYFAVGVVIALIVNRRREPETDPELNWHMVVLGWPLLVLVVALMLLLGVVIPLWDEINWRSVLGRS